MSKKILQKVVDELKKDSPDLPYIRGILETLIDMDSDTVTHTMAGTVFPMGVETGYKADEIITNEDKEYARKMAGGPIAPLH